MCCCCYSMKIIDKIIKFLQDTELIKKHSLSFKKFKNSKNVTKYKPNNVNNTTQNLPLHTDNCSEVVGPSCGVRGGETHMERSCEEVGTPAGRLEEKLQRKVSTSSWKYPPSTDTCLGIATNAMALSGSLSFIIDECFQALAPSTLGDKRLAAV